MASPAVRQSLGHPYTECSNPCPIAAMCAMRWKYYASLTDPFDSRGASPGNTDAVYTAVGADYENVTTIVPSESIIIAPGHEGGGEVEGGT